MERFELNECLENNKKITKFRQAIPQFCAIGAENFLLLTLGSTIGFLTILIPGLEDDKTDIHVDRSTISWISCINLFSAPFGCMISGPVSMYFGRKKTMQSAMIPYILTWLIFYYSTTKEMLFFGLLLNGLTGGITEASILTYAAEVSQPHLRGMLSSTLTMSVIMGIFTQFLTGKFTDWRTASLINLAYPIIGFVAFSFVPESPYWFAEKGKLKNAEKALCWLRGWVPSSQIQDELVTICNTTAKDLKSENESEKIKDKSWKEYTKQSFISPFILIILCFFIMNFAGSSTIQIFSVEIFKKLKSPLDNYTATVYLGLAQLLGTLICVFAISFTGKRLINFISITGAGLCFFGTSVYLYLIEFNLLNDRYSWIPTILLISSAFLSHIGIRSLVWILAGEIFPPKVKSFATGAAITVSYGFAAIANKTYFNMIDLIDLSGTFMVYASINFVGLVALYFMLPETEGRTLQEIELHYAGIQNLFENKETSSKMKKKPEEKILLE